MPGHRHHAHHPGLLLFVARDVGRGTQVQRIIVQTSGLFALFAGRGARLGGSVISACSIWFRIGSSRIGYRRTASPRSLWSSCCIFSSSNSVSMIAMVILSWLLVWFTYNLAERDAFFFSVTQY
jgi:hypothetical protein